MCEEVMLAAQHGQRIELWSRRKIFEEFDIRTDFVGRFIPAMERIIRSNMSAA
jgi:hypothetical protein